MHIRIFRGGYHTILCVFVYLAQVIAGHCCVFRILSGNDARVLRIWDASIRCAKTYGESQTVCDVIMIVGRRMCAVVVVDVCACRLNEDTEHSAGVLCFRGAESESASPKGRTIDRELRNSSTALCYGLCVHIRMMFEQPQQQQMFD